MDNNPDLNLSNFARNAPLELVDEPRMPPALDAAIRELLCACFPDDVNVFSQTRRWHGSAPAWSFVLVRSGRVLGHVGIVVRAIRCGGREVTVAGVQNVAVRPDLRGCGLGARLMAGAMEEAGRRGIKFGLLFCLPVLEKFYRSLGWFTVREAVTMTDENGNRVPAPEKNICMVLPLTAASFPAGAIDLQGRDW